MSVIQQAITYRTARKRDMMSVFCLKCFATAWGSEEDVRHITLDDDGKQHSDTNRYCHGKVIPIYWEDLELLKENGFYHPGINSRPSYISLDPEYRQIIRESVEKIGVENWDYSMRLPIDEILKCEEKKREQEARRKEKDERDAKRFSYIAGTIVFIIIILMAGCSNRYCSDGHRSSTSAHQQQVQRESAQLYNTWNSMKSGN